MWRGRAQDLENKCLLPPWVSPLLLHSSRPGHIFLTADKWHSNYSSYSTFLKSTPKIANCWHPAVLLTMSWVVPIFLASSLRSMVLRYRYLFRSSPSRTLRTAFCSVRLSLWSILEDKIVFFPVIWTRFSGHLGQLYRSLEENNSANALWEMSRGMSFVELHRCYGI